MSDFGSIISNAKEQRKAISKYREADLRVMLEDVQSLFNETSEYSVVYSVPIRLDKTIPILINALVSLGYTIADKTNAYYDDRPCGEYVSAKLTISCEDAK